MLSIQNNYCFYHNHNKYLNEHQNTRNSALVSFAGREKGFYIHLSKKMAFALRHKPEECGLKLDKDGYTSVSGLLEYLRSVKRFCDVTIDDIKGVMSNTNKKRFEIDGDNIRAYYGHSCVQKIEKVATQPPNVLYHGTTHEAAEKILKEGIKAQDRQHVHMSVDVETARKVGARRDREPVILVVDTEKAAKDGLKFYFGNETTWLSDYIPPEYITIKK